MSVAERISRLEGKLAKLTRPKLVIERVLFRSCQACGARSTTDKPMVTGKPCPSCGVLVAAPAWPTAAPAASPAPIASTAEAMTRRCPACSAVADLDALYCSKCGVRLPEAP